MSRSRSNSMVTSLRPWRLEEETSRIPSTVITASSITSATSVSITSGAAPSSVTLTLTTGKSTSGIWLTPRRMNEMPPKMMSAAISIQAKTGLRIEMSERFMGPTPRWGRRRPGRRWEPARRRRPAGP